MVFDACQKMGQSLLKSNSPIKTHKALVSASDDIREYGDGNAILSLNTKKHDQPTVELLISSISSIS